MAAQNKVTLTIAGDAASLQRATRQAAQATDQLANHTRSLDSQLHQLRSTAGGTAAGVDGLMYSVRAFGGEVPQAAQSTYSLALGISQLAHGARESVPAMKQWASSMTLGRTAGLGLGSAIGVVGLKMEGSLTSAGTYVRALKDMNYALATDVNVVGKHIPLLGKLTGMWKSNADSASQAAHATYDYANALKAAQNALAQNGLGVGGFPDDPDGMAFSASILDGTNAQSAQFMQNLQDNADQAAELQRASAKSAAAVSKGISDAARAAKEAAAQAKQDMLAAQKSIAQAVRGIMDAFKPQFDLDTGSTDGYSRVGDTRGGAAGGLIANLRKQAADTIKLRKDIDKLAKMGLDKGLLSTLVQGGLASLPAAEDLLHGGKLEIGQANKYAGQINSASNTIASREVARNLSKKDLHTLEVKVTGGDADLVKLVRKWVRNNGGNVQSVLGS